MYSKKEFTETAVNRGYATAGTCKIYMENNPKMLYSEDDLIEVYRFQERAAAHEDPFRKKQQYRMTPEERKQAERDSWL